jgi:hypothetical protein
MRSAKTYQIPKVSAWGLSLKLSEKDVNARRQNALKNIVNVIKVASNAPFSADAKAASIIRISTLIIKISHRYPINANKSKNNKICDFL